MILGVPTAKIVYLVALGKQHVPGFRSKYNMEKY